ncbi:uncharacterized protein LOC5572642 isoform X2 [Aedes aegypti]|uniref:Fucosyltransferase 11 (fut11) n=1 Tax=Aedes aegypti TaxID=7159 RepID=A0A6I8T4S0_AEDAE|nr:uncharacterized protein LOC5572642 isoform X2 [Aedes aegypti]
MMLLGRYRNGKLLLLSFSLLLVLCTYLYRKHGKPTKSHYNVMVWWNPYVKQLDYHRKCGEVECRFTSDRKAQKDPFFTNYLPNPNSAILIDDFATPFDLAQFISQASNNEDLYTSFLYHKTLDMYPISNQLLVNAIFKEDIYYLADRKTRSIVEFECTACVQSFHQEKLQTQQKELSCELPYFPPGNFTLKALPRVRKFVERARMEATIMHKMAGVSET